MVPRAGRGRAMPRGARRTRVGALGGTKVAGGVLALLAAGLERCTGYPTYFSGCGHPDRAYRWHSAPVIDSQIAFVLELNGVATAT